jgi:tetratricopeptide (TPR) repeat protein
MLKKICLLALGLFATAPFISAQTSDCKTAEECFKSGQAAIFDKSKTAFQNECFTKAIKLNPNYLEAYQYRAGNFYQQGKIQEALADYNKYLELVKNQPKSSKFVLAKIHFQKAECLTKLGKAKDALPAYKAAHEIMPAEEKYLGAYEKAKAASPAPAPKGGKTPPKKGK